MKPQPDSTAILVIEDDKDTCVLIRQLLKLKMSADVTIVYNCAQAREILATNDFDLVTLDYQLPDGDGLQILEEITSQDAHPPVLMVTGHGDERTAAEAFKLGASGYVVKDKRMSTLLTEEAERIVGRARLLAALQASEKRYRLLYENIGMPVYTFDVNHIVTDVNREALDVVGYTREEIVGKNTFELGILHPDDFLRAKQRADRVSTGEFLGESTYRFIMKNGDVRDVVLIASPMKDENGDLLGVVVTVRDVTELHKAVEALRDSEERYRLMHEYMGVGLFAYDRKAFLTDVNLKACELIGYTSEELLGRNILEVGILRPEDIETARKNTGLLLSGQAVLSSQYSLVKKNGELVPVNLTSAALKNEKGEVIGVTSVVIEITE